MPASRPSRGRPPGRPDLDQLRQARAVRAQRRAGRADGDRRRAELALADRIETMFAGLDPTGEEAGS